MPELDRRAVRDELGDIGADPSFDVADEADGVLIGRHVDLHPQIDVVHVDEALTEGSWHRAVELDDDRARSTDGGVHRLDRDAERAEAVPIWRRRIHEDGVQGHGPASNRRGTSDRKTGR